ncbi:hypothetical protein ACFLTJ_03385 [Chloroflexota bacterium]
MSKKVAALIVVLVVAVGYFGISWWFVRMEYALAMASLTNTSSALEGNEGELQTLAVDLELARANLADVELELAQTQENLSDMEAELEATQARLSAVESDALNLHNPTLEEAIDFLSRDRTDAHEYIEDEYVCSHFAADVNNNAERVGIRCALVEIRSPNSGHAVVAFDTVDEGLVYFDPISDDRVRPVIGRRYYKCIEPKPGFIYEKPSFDDTIMDIVVIW